MAANQNGDGGWGGGPIEGDDREGPRRSSVEETAVALEAVAAAESSPALQITFEEGLNWLVEAVEDGRHTESSPIGFYFAKLWYYETLYPLIFTVSALGQAVGKLHSRPEPRPAARLDSA